MATEVSTIEVALVAKGQQAVVAAYDQVSAATGRAEKSVDKIDKAQRAAEKSALAAAKAQEKAASATEAALKKSASAADVAERKNAEFASKSSMAFGRATTALSALGSEFGAVGTAANQAGSSVMIFSSLLGSAGMGAAVGVGVAALKLFNDTLRDAFTDAEKNADGAIARLKQRNKDAAEAAAFKKWSAPVSTVMRPGDPGFKAELAKAGAGIDKRGKLTHPDDPVAAGPGKGPGAGPEWEAMQRNDETQRRMAALDAAEAESRERVFKADTMLRGVEGVGSEGDAAAAGDATRAKLDAEFTQQRIDRQRDAADQLVDIERNRAERMLAIEHESAAQRQAVATGAVLAVASVSATALHEAIKGNKMSARAIASSIGDALWADGMANLLKAGAMAFIPGFQGNAGGLAAAASAEIAFAGVLGAATRGGGGGGGGGGGPRGTRGEDFAGYVQPAPGRYSGRQSEGGAAFLDRTRAASPTTTRASSTGGRVGNIYNTNFYSTLSPRVEDWIQIDRARREGERAGL